MLNSLEAPLFDRLRHPVDAVLACRMEIITPTDYVGPLMELAQARRGDFINMTYLTETRTTLVYDLPLAEVGNVDSSSIS